MNTSHSNKAVCFKRWAQFGELTSKLLDAYDQLTELSPSPYHPILKH